MFFWSSFFKFASANAAALACSALISIPAASRPTCLLKFSSPLLASVNLPKGSFAAAAAVEIMFPCGGVDAIFKPKSIKKSYTLELLGAGSYLFS